jgi:methyltransferase
VTTTGLYLLLVAAVGACRIVELRISRRHQRALAARGASPLPERVFGAMVALHTGILVAAVVEVLALRRPLVLSLAVPALALVVLANALRFWVIATLGEHWNVRVVASSALGVITSGPYRYVRHPNYVAVFIEPWRCRSSRRVRRPSPAPPSTSWCCASGSASRVGIDAGRGLLPPFADKPRFIPWPMS